MLKITYECFCDNCKGLIHPPTVYKQAIATPAQNAAIPIPTVFGVIVGQSHLCHACAEPSLEALRKLFRGY